MAGPQIKIQTFAGKPGENGIAWLERYSSQCKNLFKYTDEQIKSTFPYFLTRQAEAWLNSLPAATKNDAMELERLFRARFDGKDCLFSYSSIRQRPHENVTDYMTRFLQATNYRNMPEDWLVTAYVDGLFRDLRLIVKPQQLETLDNARRAAMRAEASLGDYTEVSAISQNQLPPNPMMTQLLEAMTTLCQTIKDHQQPNPKPTEYKSRPQGRNFSTFNKESGHMCKVCSSIGHFEQNGPEVLKYKSKFESDKASRNK